MQMFPQPETKDLYREEVNKLVDGIEAEIVGKTLINQDEAEDQLIENVEAHPWVTDNQGRAIQVLLHSNTPCVAIMWCQEPKRVSKDPFPFSYYAEHAMANDALEILRTRPAYKKLEENDAETEED